MIVVLASSPNIRNYNCQCRSMTQTSFCFFFFKKAILNYLEEVVKVEVVDAELDVEMLKAKQAITFTIYRKFYLQSYILFQFKQQVIFISRILLKISKHIASLNLKAINSRSQQKIRQVFCDRGNKRGVQGLISAYL